MSGLLTYQGMTAFLLYNAKVALLVMVFYMCYRLLLARETFHRVNRVVLLLTALLSFVLPLCIITLHTTVHIPAPQPTIEAGAMTATLADDDGLLPAITIQRLTMAAMMVYLAGVAAVLGRLAFNIFKVWRLIRHSQLHPQDDGTVVAVTTHNVAPFSWMRYIVLNRDDYEAQNTSILAHERGHIRQRHSLDLLLVDLLAAWQWFNPAIWMLRQDLCAIHEYEADQAVLSQGINMRQYQYLLIRKAAVHGGYYVVNGISHSTLKNRINMMLHKKSSKASLLKVLAMVPIVGAAIALNARTEVHTVYTAPQQQKTMVKKGQKTANVKMGSQTLSIVGQQQSPAAKAERVASNDSTVNKKSQVPATEPQSQEGERVFDVVEKMPEFPGGTSAMLLFLNKGIHYPVAAMKSNTQGRVIVSFVVGKDGTISQSKVVKSVSPELDAEALRVVNSMPAWQPGMQNNKPVNVKYTIPISFKLSDNAPSNKEQPTTVGVATLQKGMKYVVDGVEMSEEMAVGYLKKVDIDNIKVDKSDSDHPTIRITTKQPKKEE